MIALIHIAATIVYAETERDQIFIAGSSTVYPLTKVVAEKFGRSTGFKNPRIESTGTGAGLKLFCKGIGINTVDIANASRRIKNSEYDLCQKNGVKEIIEILIGYDGIVLVNDIEAQPFSITRFELFLALVKQVPTEKNKELVTNPYKYWSDINQKLPNIKIEVLGPPPTSGTRDAFIELVMEHGCNQFEWIKKLKKSDKSSYKSICHPVRDDGVYLDTGENDNLVIRKLKRNSNALGILGFSFLAQNTQKIKAAVIDGVSPDTSSIASGDYPVSRPLYFYVKKDHIGRVPGIKEFLSVFTDPDAIGKEGYLIDKGLIPLSQTQLTRLRNNVAVLKELSL